MKFSLTTETTAKPVALSPLAVAELENDLAEAYENLDASIKGMKEVSDVMDNIQTSLKLLSTYGQSAVPQLNMDKGLESLMGIPEKLIAADKAIETLDEQKKGLWKQLKEWVTKAWNFILDLFRKKIPAQAEECKKEASQTSAEMKEEIKKNPDTSSKMFTMTLPDDLKLDEVAFKYIDNLHMCLDSMLKFAKESSALAQEQIAHPDKFIDYQKFVSEHVRDMNVGSGKFGYEWELTNRDGNGSIRVHFTNVGPGTNPVGTLNEAGIKTPDDVDKISAACDHIEKFLNELATLPDLSNYMSDNYVINVDLDNREWTDNNTGAKYMSPKAVVVCHLRFFGCIGNMVNAQWLVPYKRFVRACKYAKDHYNDAE